MPDMVSRRYFLHASGFDPYDAAAHHRRFAREAARFGALWNVEVAVSPLRQGVDGSHHTSQGTSQITSQITSRGTSQDTSQDTSRATSCDSSWSVTATAPGWRVETEYILLDWSDIVRGAVARPALAKLAGGVVAFADLVVTGTARRYFAANWRYGMFFLVPFLNVFAFVAAAVAAGWLTFAAVAAATGAIAAGVAAVAVAVLAFTGLMRVPGERWRLGQAMADWTFARDWTRGRNAAMAARLEAFAARIAACARTEGVDEIVVSGHSLGAAVAVDALARAFERDPGLGRGRPRVALLTVGAVIPKIALHPRGGWLRERSRRLAAEPAVTWTEYQARDDFISFYKVDPVTLRRFGNDYRARGLGIIRVQLGRMLSDDSLRRHRKSYMRMHYQFVMANERRAPYDYFMLVCGPAPFAQTVTAPDGPDGLYGADGAYAGSAPDPAALPSSLPPSLPPPSLPAAATG